MTFPLQLGVRSDVVFDGNRKNRFLLRRTWDESLPKLGICMTNPSKANGELDDPTLRKVQVYARRWGYGSVTVVNAFSWCATDPRELRTREESETTIDQNLTFIIEAAEAAHLFVCAWGNWGTLDGRSKYILDVLRRFQLHALRLSKGGNPEHPLYLPSALTPIPYSPEAEAAA